MTREELVEKIRQIETKDGRAIYGNELREEVLNYSRSRLAAGDLKVTIAEDLGIKAATLNRWHQKVRHASGLGFKKTSDGALAFVRLEPVKEFGTSLEVMSGGRCVRVPVGFDEGTLVRVLTLLEGMGL